MAVWRSAFRHEPESILQALSVLRFWRIEVKAILRGLPRASEDYRREKRLEEQLEAACLDLHEAWMTQLSARKHGG